MKVAAYQAPLLDVGLLEVVGLIKEQVRQCEEEGVEILCCPEGILGGLADNVRSPFDIALDVESGELEELLAPLASDTVNIIIGFTEATNGGKLHNSAALLRRGKVVGIYRKLHPAINRSIYSPGDQIPTFTIGLLRFGIVICNDSNFTEPAHHIASQGAVALFIPTNNGLPPHKADVLTIARSVHATRAAENRMTVVVADVAGRHGSLISHGVTAIYDSDGTLLASSKSFQEDLLVADISVDGPPLRSS